MNAADLPQCVQLISKVEIAAAGERAVNCGRCKKLGDFRKEKQTGFCMVFRRMQATCHPVICNRFERKE